MFDVSVVPLLPLANDVTCRKAHFIIYQTLESATKDFVGCIATGDIVPVDASGWGSLIKCRRAYHKRGETNGERKDKRHAYTVFQHFISRLLIFWSTLENLYVVWKGIWSKNVYYRIIFNILRIVANEKVMTTPRSAYVILKKKGKLQTWAWVIDFFLRASVSVAFNPLVLARSSIPRRQRFISFSNEVDIMTNFWGHQCQRRTIHVTFLVMCIIIQIKCHLVRIYHMKNLKKNF